MPITKHNFIVSKVEDLAGIIRDAFYIAQEGRPGPVLVDIPKDITAQFHEYEKVPKREIVCRHNLFTASGLDEAADMIKHSRKPLIFAGGGVILSNASNEMKAFAEAVNAPVCMSLMAMGGFPASHRLFTGMIGMHGTKTSNLAAMECDLLIAIGARFSDRVTSNASTFAPHAKILHIDIDPAEIGKNIRVHHYLHGDVAAVLSALTPLVQSFERPEWDERIHYLLERYPLSYVRQGEVMPQQIIAKICELTKGEAIIATEVGQHQMWTAQYYNFIQPRTFLTSGGLGTMGYGLGAAIGAQLGCPEKRVFNIAGDGSFRMNLTELATAVEYNIPIIEVILNNHVLGMVRQWQDMFYDKRFSHTTIDRCTDFVKLAEAFGAVGLSITTPDEIEPVLKQALAAGRPVVINCEIGEDVKVFPMVAPGKSIEHTITEEEA